NQLRYWKLTYRPGRIIRRFLARDIRREVEVVDVSRIESGVISARIRTWNLLYAARKLVPQPPFGEVREVEIRNLWQWTGETWGGPVPDSSKEPPYVDPHRQSDGG
ncbi:MAG TPA: hypothetical protein VHB77_02015, partial [Planctomycetaceae bacterium]|nr:hypothetical protein [Planctomycetaceae bacterium]